MIEALRRKSSGSKFVVDKRNIQIKNSWVKIVDPSQEEISSIAETFNLDKDLMLDGLDVYEVPRVEEFDGKLYLFLRVPNIKENQYTSSMLLILTREGVFTISKDELPFYDAVLNDKKILTTKSTNFLLNLLSLAYKQYSLEIRNSIKTVNKERRQFSKLGNKDIIYLIKQEDLLNDFMFSLGPLIDVHKQLSKFRRIKFEESEKEMIEDLVVDLDQASVNCRSTLKNISNMRVYYSTTLSNNLNKTIGLLTIFTIFLTIPTLLSSIYGMNIPLPYQNSENVLYWLLGIVFLSYIFLIYLMRKFRILGD